MDNPTYEFFPTRGPPISSPVLENTLPTNLFPLTWLLPSGRLLIQSNYATVLLDYKARTEVSLDDMPDAVRTYPASAGTVMLPLTPANNWTATIIFCGGSEVATERYASRCALRSLLSLFSKMDRSEFCRHSAACIDFMCQNYTGSVPVLCS